nr:DUF2460 domain-containing protein [uncultured Sphingomonas sp.]
MGLWFTRPDAPVEMGWVKRFRARDWTVDFPRGAMASAVVLPGERSLRVEARFLRKGDLVGLIYESEDRHSHPARTRETKRDYSAMTLSFRWVSSGLVPLDAVNGPVLTIEGRDAAGVPTSWYVRLWNYAQGSSNDAVVSLDFDALDAGFGLPADAVRVWPKDIDRMFISLVAPGFVDKSAEMLAAPVEAWVELRDIVCDKSGSVVAQRCAWAPEHGFGACTSYDDQYNLTPSRVVEAVEAAGFRGTINHYVGMSHYPTLGADGLVDAGAGMCGAALAWHRAFAAEAKARGFELIWSLSYELLDMFCPTAWKQRAWDGVAAATGYDPPSALLSPANAAATDYLGRIAAELIGISVEAGLVPRFQVGEPWWWVRSDGAICCYDDAARAAMGGAPAEIHNARTGLSAVETEVLDQAGALLASSTAAVVAAAKAVAPDAVTHLLPYVPGVLDPDAPELKRANLPIGWAKPAFDVLQVEDYEWVTGGRRALREAGYALVEQRLGYAPSEQHYFAGFVASADRRGEWHAVVDAAREAEARGVAKTFIWAMPQWVRDGVTLMVGEDDLTPFEDVQFPIAIGQEASVAPGFSTNVVTSASGHEYRNANWQQAKLRFDAGPGVRGEAELGELLSFFRARRGSAVAFRFRDPFDFSSTVITGSPGADDVEIGVGDGSETRFALAKAYGPGERRRITRPVAGSVRVAVDGVEVSSGWTLEPLGVVSFDAPPGAGVVVTAGYLFDVPVRFGEDRLEINRASFLAGEAPSVPLVEVREG